jgi:hypothetical protein
MLLPGENIDMYRALIIMIAQIIALLGLIGVVWFCTDTARAESYKLYGWMIFGVKDHEPDTAHLFPTKERCEEFRLLRKEITCRPVEVLIGGKR